MTGTELLERLARALGEAHTPASVASVLARAFGETVIRVDLSTSSTTFRVARAGEVVVTNEPRVALLRESAVVTDVAHARDPNVRRVARDGASTLFFLRLRSDATVTIWFGGEASLELDRALLPVVEAMIETALANCQTFARVGGLARDAQVRSRELSQRLAHAEALPEIVATAPEMRRLLDDVLPTVARQDVTVLLLGETGVGKELFARRIHALSRRAANGFLATNCGALPESLVDSTLFGHERGAFTGALASQKGVFERAHRGTLLLDEVGELTAASQVRLLRVLEERVIERVGGGKPLAVDVRVVAATHRDLRSLVASGHFRSDLFHRLAVVPLSIPPLRARLADLDVLVPALLAKIAARHQLPLALPTARDLAPLRRYDWPGNVRELENVLARALLFGGGKLAISSALRTLPTSPRVEQTFASASREHIESALSASGGRIHGAGGAAERLGLKPTTLQSKMRRLGIVRPARARSPRAR